MKIKLLTQWRDKELVCTCPPKNKCRKDRGCELLEFTLNAYDKKDILECFKNDDKRR